MRHRVPRHVLPELDVSENAPDRRPEQVGPRAEPDIRDARPAAPACRCVREETRATPLLRARVLPPPWPRTAGRARCVTAGHPSSGRGASPVAHPAKLSPDLGLHVAQT